MTTEMPHPVPNTQPPTYSAENKAVSRDHHPSREHLDGGSSTNAYND